MRADLAELADVLARPLHEDAAVERGQVERLARGSCSVARGDMSAPSSGAIALRRELVDAAVEVAGDVPRVALGVDAQLVAELGVAHAAEMAGEVAPLGELGAVRAVEAPRLEVGRLVEREERIPRLRRDAMDDLLDDGGAGGVEAEDGGGHGAMKPAVVSLRKARVACVRVRSFQSHCKSCKSDYAEVRTARIRRPESRVGVAGPRITRYDEVGGRGFESPPDCPTAEE